MAGGSSSSSTKRTPRAASSKLATKSRAVKGKDTKRARVSKTASVKRTTSKTKTTATATPSRPVKKGETISIARQPLGHLLVEKSLREAGFRGGISSDKKVLERYSNDESIFCVRPQVVLQPKSAADVERAVKLIAEKTKRFSSLSLTPRAAGTGLSGGSLSDSVVLDVSTHLTEISDPVHKKGEVTITVEPGAMWRNVEKVLAKEGRYIPSFPASKDICTIGGAVGNNAAGPDSLRYGHTANFVESLNVVLHDGQTYTVAPLTFKEFKAVTKKDSAYARILSETLKLIEKHEKTIKQAEPKTAKNTAGYALWDVLDTTVAQFKKGKGTFDLTKVLCGSQGTIGIITSITLRTEPVASDTHLIAVPVFDLADAGKVITKALEYSPTNVELFDGFTFDLALKNPEFFKDRLEGLQYYKVLLSMYTTYHLRYQRKLPEFILLITLDEASLGRHTPHSVLEAIRTHTGTRARLVTNPTEAEMYWQVRRASYTLSKFQDPKKRPAAFLEDITVPPEKLAKFFVAIKKLLKKYHVTAAVHGHGGNGHLHFYPLIDFTQKTAPALVSKMADEFFKTATDLGGSICGEHNDGIIRTPHLSKMFSKPALQLFVDLEHIFDPDDIFNPGKKVNPRFDIKDTIRQNN